MVKLSGAEWVVLLVLSVVWAGIGYALSEKDRRRLGRTPWGLPSGLWAFFWFLSLVLGLVLFLIAHSSGVRRSQQPPPFPGSPVVGPAQPTGMSANPTVGELFPSYPRPANGPPQGTDGSVASAPVPMSPDPGTTSPLSPPAWHPDPSGRFHYRWWDGNQWTSQVSTDGHVATDTSPDQRIGPY
jgi:hypothetical protein